MCCFIICLAPRTGNCKMNQFLRCDWLLEWARWSYRACSGLPAFPARKLFSKSIPLYWPILVSYFFCEFMDLDCVSVYKNAKKELGQPSWPLAWSITIHIRQIRHMPVQLCPSPEYPSLHEQLYPPLVLLQTALKWHLWEPLLHSSTSKINV